MTLTGGIALAFVGHAIDNSLDQTWKVSASLMKGFENVSVFQPGQWIAIAHTINFYRYLRRN